MKALIAAGFMTYLSEADEDDRKTRLLQWTKAFKQPDFIMEKFLSSEKEQLEWKVQGLPSDELSFQNATVITQVRAKLSSSVTK